VLSPFLLNAEQLAQFQQSQLVTSQLPFLGSRTWTCDVLTPVRSGQIRRDVKRAEKRGKDLGELRNLLELS
jgi:hypothetical protein